MKLTDRARGQQCMIRIPQYCIDNRETTVACHYSLAGYFGKGLKSPDILSAHGCFVCHQIVDGKIKTDLTYDQRRLYHAEGVLRTIAKLAGAGHIEVKP